ncbi:MAG: 5-(carboxyamino)imidazole ribonucleotide mutase [Pseudanabaenaceae cyanobacterium bins.68]|nr:5-(carboxyamino)imidazole ribonucleotide mutase [Pseudanabaenaceae cyanobacterium bins.68]
MTISIIMGSDSDLGIMSAAVQVCQEFGVAHQVEIISAHRTPLRLVEFAQTAQAEGIKVIIAGAGGAAHLPGMVAALTVLPVIGVPIPSAHLQGLDSLYSIVQMPKGIPVATVAIGNATNAALLGIQILAIAQPDLVTKLQEFRQSQTQTVQAKQAQLAQLGVQPYLAQGA